MGPSRQERKEIITTMRRQQILDAALDIFTHKGLAAATTSEIAEAAGVAEGTIYNYFPNKRELFIEVIKNFIITVPLQEMIEKLPEGDFNAAFQNILRERFRLIENKVTSRIPNLMAEIMRDPEIKSLWTEQVLQPFLSRIEKMYQTLESSGRSRHIEPAVLVRAIGGMILGFMMLKIMEGDASPLNRLPQHTVIDSMIDLLLHGLLNGPDQRDAERKTTR
jgi:AcrR family transcriptional regulator